MRRLTEYDRWCSDNYIGDANLFLSNLKNAGQNDKRFLELFNMLNEMENTVIKFRKDINNIEDFELELRVLYGYGFELSNEELLILMCGSDVDLSNASIALNKAFEIYKMDYVEFMRRLDICKDIDKSNQILRIINDYKRNLELERLKNQKPFDIKDFPMPEIPKEFLQS